MGNTWFNPRHRIRVDREEVLARLARLFDNPVVLLVLRGQKSIIESLYCQQIREPQGFRSFEFWFESEKKMDIAGSTFSAIDYFFYVQVVAQRLTTDIHILSIEQLKTNPCEFAAKLGKALELDKMSILSRLETKRIKRPGPIELLADRVYRRSALVRRVVNLFPARVKQDLRKGISAVLKPKAIHWSDKNLDWLVSRYQHSNLQLFEKYGVEIPLE